ncbi:PqqD family peptide modification chaperone [Microbacterium hydrocarbonoxydans]|uniref:PqqD family peptide modification chaperone n=1 Tax=Microbacterium hydrocarbonoxydans TaxID=273678 RepID=UPI0013DA6F56|nr:PqqD family peptide modification chaperone [Microbacterium hydrocarbonoxydans]
MTRLMRGTDVGVVDDGIRVFAAALPQGPIVVLAGIGAVVWRAAQGADLAGVAAVLAADGVSEDGQAEADAEMYVQALLEAHLLEEEDA